MLCCLQADRGGYDLLVIDAMHKANFASRLCHSCTPNCATKVTAVDGHYMIGLYAIKDIQPGQELTFNYHSVTEVSPREIWRARRKKSSPSVDSCISCQRIR